MDEQTPPQSPSPADPVFSAPPPPPPQSPPPRPAPAPRRPRSSLWGVLLVLAILFTVFLGILGVGALMLSRLMGAGPSTANLSFGEKIGLVRIEGMILPGPEFEFVMNALRDLGERSSVRGIVVRINSPGGSVGASQELYSMLLHLRNDAKKRVYISMGDTAASGGYYIASAGEQIYSLKGTLTGSIGVILSKPDLSGISEKLGIAMENVKSGRFKDAGDSTRALSQPEREMFDTLIMNTYQQFVNDIIEIRRDALTTAAGKLSPEQWASYQFDQPLTRNPLEFLKAVADGRAYTGEQALELGLVDRIGTMDDTIRALARQLGIQGWPEIHEPRRQPSLRDLLTGGMNSLLPGAHSPLQYRLTMP